MVSTKYLGSKFTQTTKTYKIRGGVGEYRSFNLVIKNFMSIDKDIEQGMDHGRDTHGYDLTYENEQSTLLYYL